jgi:DNA-binding NarL/FixJ family response regulator
VKVFLIDAHAIYRIDLLASLSAMSDVEQIHEASTIEKAWASRALLEADIVVLDPDLEGGYQFIRDVREAIAAQVVVCSAMRDEHALLAAVQAGAVAFGSKDTPSAETLATGIRAASTGADVIAPELLGALLQRLSGSPRDLEPRGLSLSWLTARESQVLRLVANGRPTREVARQLCHSGRTIKSVIHDVIAKLNARSRSHAVAEAGRASLI